MLIFENLKVQYSQNFEPLFYIAKLQLNLNDILIISGDNGSGKSTLLKLLNTYNKKNISGTISWNNKPLKHTESILMPQFTEKIFYHTTLNEEINFFCKFSNISKKKIQKNLEFILDEPFSKTAEIPLIEMDNGRLKCLNILFTIMSQRNLILLDEPDTGFSFKEKEKIANLITKYSHNKIIIIVSHDIFFHNSLNAKYLNLTKKIK